MTGEIGQLALCLALALSLVQAGAGLWSARSSAAVSRSLAFSTALGFFVFVVLAFAALTYGFVTSDFSILDVAQNSHTLKPLVYKITGVWGNHEGSMLLWVLVLAVYTALIAVWRRGGDKLAATALGVMGLLAAAFLLFILLTSDPFLRTRSAAVRRPGLEPVAAGSRPRLPPAHALPRLCRPFGDVRLCSGGPHHRRRRRRMGACRPPVHAGGLDRSYAWDHARIPGGPITCSAGEASGSGIRSKTPR